MEELMPVIFIGHGNPLNTLLDNDYTRKWASLGAEIPRPKAILCISAHWYRSGTAVTAMPFPQTIHDFGGFPQELYDIQYPAPGDTELAERVRNLVTSCTVSSDMEWGFDHGAWTVLRHLFPMADVPIVQLSIDKTQPASFHFKTGRQLAPLREEGILIVGSGNLVHNLHAYAWGQHNSKVYDWAMRFEDKVRKFLAAGDDDSLVAYEKLGRDAELSIPTPDHYLPFLYAVGARRERERISFPVEGFDGGSVSMLTVKFG